MLSGKISYAHEKGRREEQEDRFYFGDLPSRKPTGVILAVMDGHAGYQVSEMCLEEFNKFIPETLPDDYDAQKILRDFIEYLNEKTKDCYAGTTLSIAWIEYQRDEVVIATLGDSPVVVIDKNQTTHISRFHNSQINVEERDAALKRGGFLYGGYIAVGKHRIQVTRALGDSPFGEIISKEPEIFIVKHPRSVVVASDGMLDQQHNAGGLVSEITKTRQGESCAQSLMKWAKQRRLEDNTTVLMWKSDCG